MFEESFSEVRLENMLYRVLSWPRSKSLLKASFVWRTGGLDDNNVDRKQLIVNLNYLILIAISYDISMSNYK